jgi:hypothetical protein
MWSYVIQNEALTKHVEEAKILLTILEGGLQAMKDLTAELGVVLPDVDEKALKDGSVSDILEALRTKLGDTPIDHAIDYYDELTSVNRLYQEAQARGESLSGVDTYMSWYRKYGGPIVILPYGELVSLLEAHVNASSPTSSPALGQLKTQLRDVQAQINQTTAALQHAQHASANVASLQAKDKAIVDQDADLQDIVIGYSDRPKTYWQPINGVEMVPQLVAVNSRRELSLSYLTQYDGDGEYFLDIPFLYGSCKIRGEEKTIDHVDVPRVSDWVDVPIETPIVRNPYDEGISRRDLAMVNVMIL